MKDVSKSRDSFLKQLNYTFKNQKFLDIALTHSSYVNEHNMKYSQSNERLEFLGDSIIGFVIAEYLFLEMKENREGLLSKIRAQLVNEHTLSLLANKIGLGKFIRFGRGEAKSGGSYRSSILADALEALIGAVYLDSSYEETRQVVLHLYREVFLKLDSYHFNNDYKSALQEALQEKGMIPEYQLTKTLGPDNDRTFYTDVKINKKKLGWGIGKTKKKSEQNAAKMALERMGEIFGKN
ncbi:MAG: ribonuclease III [Tissierellia bacterium]|nr:ribonuclease III [Tissierellia bacterium]